MDCFLQRAGGAEVQRLGLQHINVFVIQEFFPTLHCTMMILKGAGPDPWRPFTQFRGRRMQIFMTKMYLFRMHLSTFFLRSCLIPGGVDGVGYKSRPSSTMLLGYEVEREIIW